jgi:hypothetical protein
LGSGGWTYTTSGVTVASSSDTQDGYTYYQLSNVSNNDRITFSIGGVAVFYISFNGTNWILQIN